MLLFCAKTIPFEEEEERKTSVIIIYFVAPQMCIILCHEVAIGHVILPIILWAVLQWVCFGKHRQGVHCNLSSMKPAEIAKH